MKKERNPPETVEEALDCFWVDRSNAGHVPKLSEYKLVLNWVEGGRTPPITYDRIRELALVLFPVGSVLTTMAALESP
jgi:hypothetical protein